MKRNQSVQRVSLAERVIALVEDARRQVATVANIAQVYTNFAIGRMIVEEQQGGSTRAGYGETVIPDLSEKLTRRFGRGWSVQTLAYMRQLYLTYAPQIFQSPIGKSIEQVENLQSPIGNSPSFTRSFFLIDLKLKKVGHDELGQMQMYVHYFDRQIKLEEENPTIGILLSSETIDRALVEMTLPECEHNRIFVKQYKTVLPSKEALKRIVIDEKRKYENERLLALAASKKPKPPKRR